MHRQPRKPSFAAEQLRQHLTRFVSANLWPAGLALAYLAAVALGHALGGNGCWQGFCEGVLLTLVLATVAVAALLHTGGVYS